MNQLSFASLDFAAKKKRTKRDVFLTEMAAVVPWGALEALIDRTIRRSGRKAGGGRSHYRPCCTSIACSNGTTCLTLAPKKHSMTFNRCARSQVSNSAATPSLTRRQSSISVICSSVTT